MWYKMQELDDGSLASILADLEETIQEWEEDGVYRGDQGYQDMLMEREDLYKEQERRMNEQSTEEG